MESRRAAEFIVKAAYRSRNIHPVCYATVIFGDFLTPPDRRAIAMIQVIQP